jgi:hypothetical protein
MRFKIFMSKENMCIFVDFEDIIFSEYLEVQRSSVL